MGFKVDEWVWGREQIIWGFAPTHRYTLKILEPKKGRIGCLSLQYHQDKSESWIVFQGTAWVLVVVEGKVCTRLMRPGDVQNVGAQSLHRLAAVTDDLKVIEPSTPDVHAADKSLPKDVVRLHCVHGRQCALPRDEVEADLIRESISVTEEALAAIERGEVPGERNLELLLRSGGKIT